MPEGRVIYVIRREPPKKRISSYFDVTYHKQIERMQKCKDKFFSIKHIINILPSKGKMVDTLRFAQVLAKDIDVPVDREARRSKDCLICWFCENWSSIQDIFSSVYTSLFANSICNGFILPPLTLIDSK